MSEQLIRIPIEITIRVGSPIVETDALVTPSAGATGTGAARSEAIPVDEDYDSREGYGPTFLGKAIPIPTLTEEAIALASIPDGASDGDYLLHYHHFSIAMNKERRLLFFAACNTTRNPDFKGKKSRSELGRDQWILDPRIPVGHQVTTRELYGPTDFDRGHVVRREDAYWGRNEGEAAYANYDSFHYTNCTPQHSKYNQSSQKGLWGLLENHIGNQAKDEDLNFSIFAGPVMARNDPHVLGVKVPRQFWKIVVAKRKGSQTGFGAWAFLLSQAKLVREQRDKFGEGVFDPGEFATYLVSVARIEELTDVRFDDIIKQSDVAGGKDEAPAASARLISDLSEIPR
jgi:endonuclease G, mitochondrial